MNDEKPYKLFLGLDQYPHGGYVDFRGRFASLDSGKAVVERNFKEPYHWAHFVLEDKIVLYGNNQEDRKDPCLWIWEVPEKDESS